MCVPACVPVGQWAACGGLQSCGLHVSSVHWALVQERIQCNLDFRNQMHVIGGQWRNMCVTGSVVLRVGQLGGTSAREI